MEQLDISDICRGKTLVIEVFKDRDELSLILFTGDEFHHVVGSKDEIVSAADKIFSEEGTIVACFDMRHLVSAGIELPPSAIPVYDIRILYGYPDSIFEMATRELGREAEKLVELERQLKANVRACKTARVDASKHPVRSLIPNGLLRKVLRLRAMATMALFEKLRRERSEALRSYESGGYGFACALYRSELNGVHIDRSYVQEQLKLEHPRHIASWLRSAGESNRDGLLFSRFNPIGGKTGRIKIDRGFNSLGIPHGIPRKAIRSRFEGGKIYSFDFNAIDYRCIIGSMEDGRLRELYDGATDFHERTTQIFLNHADVTSERRKVVKELTYVTAYGGNAKTISEKTGLSLEMAELLLGKFEDKFPEIGAFRRELHMKAMRDGFVELPNGRRIPVAQDDHPGKVLGLYGQSYSAYVFEKAFTAAEKILRPMKSKLMFSVFDEVVVDMHPDEFVRDVEIKEAMEWAEGGIDLVVGMNCGEDYEQASD